MNSALLPKPVVEMLGADAQQVLQVSLPYGQVRRRKVELKDHRVYEFFQNSTDVWLVVLGTLAAELHNDPIAGKEIPVGTMVCGDPLGGGVFYVADEQKGYVVPADYMTLLERQPSLFESIEP